MQMENALRAPSAKPGLPLILLAAVVQGWALYGLHLALKEHHWPATDQTWLSALYALAVFIPVTLELLADYARLTALWVMAVVLGAAYFYFGWHHGAVFSTAAPTPIQGGGEYFSLALLLMLLWLLALPFAQGRLATGGWVIRYESLFTNAWRNKLMLAEAALFTGLFWLLLFLWQVLFHLLGIDYFRNLFEEPVFIYPVTSLAFGCAMHLIGSIDRLTSVVLEQVLSVLKWLGLLDGVILALFTIALVLKLPGLEFTGKKAISATWLLWLTAVVVLLLNAAFRDGSVAQPYPRWIGQWLRVVVPLTVIVSLTALYALTMRSSHYGLTVGRVWGLVVACAASVYSVGYSLAALGKGAWLRGMARVNVLVALALIVVIAAALTPVLSPYRLAADSQFRIVRDKGLAALSDDRANQNVFWRDNALQYLRFEAGRYGVARLRELASLQAGPDAQSVSRLAKQLLDQNTRGINPPNSDYPEVLAKLHVYPEGRSLDPEPQARLQADLLRPENGFAFQHLSENDVAGIYVALRMEGPDNFVFLNANHGLVYDKREGHWDLVGDLHPSSFIRSLNLNLVDELSNDHVSAAVPAWKELSIGGRVFRVDERQRTASPPPTR
jgi:Domain of unknown function (DUF4153)